MSLNRASREGYRAWLRVATSVNFAITALLVGAVSIGQMLLSAPGQPVKNPPVKPATFEADIAPILKNRTCLGCHGPSLKMKELNLSTYQTTLQGSESGPVIVPGKPDESRL